MTESKLVKSMAKILKKSSISKKFRKIIELIHFALPWGILGIILIGPVVSNICFSIIRNVNIIISSNGRSWFTMLTQEVTGKDDNIIIHLLNY